MMITHDLQGRRIRVSGPIRTEDSIYSIGFEAPKYPVPALWTDSATANYYQAPLYYWWQTKYRRKRQQMLKKYWGYPALFHSIVGTLDNLWD